MSGELCLVGYTFRNYSAEFACAMAQRHGYVSVELRDFRGFDWWSLSGLRKALPATVSLAATHNLTPQAVFYPIQVPESVNEDRALAEYQEFLLLLKGQNIRIWHTQVRVSGVQSSREALGDCYHAVGSFLSRLGALAQSTGVGIAIESHMGTIHDTAAALWRLLEQCDSEAITASLDFANLYIENEHEDMETVIRRFDKRIGYIHLKNVIRRISVFDWNIPLRMGDIDYRRLLPVLRKHYAGTLGVEYCGPGDPVWVVADDAAYLREICSA